MKLSGKDISATLWISLITGIYVFNGLSYLSIIKKINTVFISIWDGIWLLFP